MAEQHAYEGSRKLYKRLKAVYAGIGENAIQGYLNSSKVPSKLNPTFNNEAPLQPIIASEPMEILEADLVDLRTHPQQNDGKTYKYVLAVIDVFSRYVEILL